MSERFTSETKEKWSKMATNSRKPSIINSGCLPVTEHEFFKTFSPYKLARILAAIRDGLGEEQVRENFDISAKNTADLFQLYKHLIPTASGVSLGSKTSAYYKGEFPMEHPKYQLKDLSPEELEILENMAPIKLLLIDTMADGTKRLQSQLYVGKTTADFVQDPDGVIKMWGKGEKGFDFYPYEHPYEIVTSKKEVARQSLT